MQHSRQGHWARRALVVLLVAAAPAVASVATAEDYPTRPIRVLVPAGAGGPSDIGARFAAEALGRVLGTSVVVEDRRGSLNTIEAYLAGEPDGYTILEAALGSLTFLPAAKHVSYDVERDFIPLGTVWRSALMLAVRPGLGVNRLGEFVAVAKARPASITIGSAGIGTASHLTMELLKREAGIDVIHVPFRGTGAALPAVIGGQVDAMFSDIGIIEPQLKSGTLRPLAVAAAQRAPALPDVPTMGDAGLPGATGEVWFGLVASARTPPDIVRRLQDGVAAAHEDPVYREKVARLGASLGEPGPGALARLIASDGTKWRAIVQTAGIRLE
jgi:tripartite-type tricarboxylate transporter receptor subunit TctC